ncbi:MAG: thioredoxin domain-containing protein [Chitinophagales bacterium]
MKNKVAGILLLMFLFCSACNSQSAGVKTLSADEFEKGINGGKVQIVDVRTPEEYSEKHIANSKNINVNDGAFEQQMNALDKNTPVYIYCLAGSRSAKAADWAASNGFKQVYNLDGGITAWIGNKKPVETPFGSNIQSGISFDNYLQQVKSDKLVLVDFNAVWCGPCKTLKPIVEKIIKKNKDVVQLLDLDVDKNPVVSNTMNVKAIPLLILYKDGKEVWRNMGLTDEATIMDQIKKYSR